ncbi:hypothetical protein ALC57_00780 [Trachymyrmex cornetzi]|uniref:Uncharacterized protein n=1 Tax=Trachymyrmex cornetzi TaxID=471704 RepID=A0A151JRC2_9HYME|nr:hypothetical protein ALC57_00780 [Trachymyrmex cornetzi]
MPRLYSNSEYADMVYLYGFCDGNVNAAYDGVFAPLQNKRRTAIILKHFDQNPSTSVRRSGCELGISSTLIWKTLSADRRYPYHLQRVQHFLSADMVRRRVFCDWFLNQTNNDPHFPQNILWTDEAIFTRHVYYMEFYDLFEDIPLNMRRNSWFQLDDCPAHYGRGSRQWLNIHFPRRCLGRAGPVVWIPRSPDLTPLDFFVWGMLKQKV